MARERYDYSMFRRLVFWLLIVASVWLATTHGSAVSEIVVTARYGSWQWLLVAVVAQLAYFAVRVALYRATFRAAGVHRRYLELVPVLLGATYVTTVTPGAGASTSALFGREAIARGHDPQRALRMPVISQLVQFAGFAVVMFAGFAYLVSLDTVHVYEVLSSVVVLGAILAMVAGLALAVVRPDVLTGLLGGVERRLRPVMRVARRGMAEGWSARIAARYADTGRALAENPGALLGAWALAVAMYAVDLVSFIGVGFALGWPALGALVASFSVGMLVWMVSPVPQGIGVVEAVIALMLASFGADAATAVLISVTFRVLTFWAPLAIGAFAARRVDAFATLNEEAAEVFPVRLAATVTFFVGVMNLLSALTPAVAERLRLLESILPLQAEYSRLAAAVAGVALILLARGLWRRKRMVWLIAVIVLGVSVLSHLLKGLDYEEAAISSALLILLLVKRGEFRARSDAPSLMAGVRVLAVAFVVTLTYGTLGFFLLERQFSVGEFRFWPALRQTVIVLTQFYDPGIHPLTRFGSFFIGSIYVVGIFGLSFALVTLLRPVLERQVASPAERRRAHEIVSAYGRTPLAQLALLPDKSYLFVHDCVVAYRLVGDVVVALGDPVGPAAQVPAAIHAFAEKAAENDWSPAFYQVLPDYLDAYRGEGFSAARIGQEAVVDAQGFSLSGKRFRVERNLMNRLGSEGFSAVYYPPPLQPSLVSALRDVSDAWLLHTGGSEMAFSLGWFDEEYLRGCGVMTVEGPDGAIEAFANLLAEPAANGMTIDLMRYRPSAPDGVMDFAFVRMIEWAREQGYATFNLGFSALSGTGDEEPGVERVLRLVYQYGNRFYSFKGLFAFKNKFRPEWEPRYLVYRDAPTLPGVFAAVVRANSGAPDTDAALVVPAAETLPA